MLKQRILTTVVLIPLVLLALYYLPQHFFETVLAIIMLGCAWEWTTLMKVSSMLERITYLCVIALLCYGVTWVAMGYFLYAMVIGVMVASVIVHQYQNKQIPARISDIGWYLIGTLLFVSCWYSINILRFKVGGSNQLLMLLLLVWTTDSAAYFTGKYFGKTPLANAISPAKTREGLVGAAIAVLILTLFEGVIAHIYFPQFFFILLINAITFIASIYGDLFESMLKRIANCKDSGSCLPGHGGLLDRLDSLFFAAPCYTTGLLLLNFYLH